MRPKNTILMLALIWGAIAAEARPCLADAQVPYSLRILRGEFAPAQEEKKPEPPKPVLPPVALKPTPELPVGTLTINANSAASSVEQQLQFLANHPSQGAKPAPEKETPAGAEIALAPVGVGGNGAPLGMYFEEVRDNAFGGQ